jgi:HEAT repeat protein
MEARELIQQLATKTTRLEAMRGLVGGVTATELRHVEISERAFEALVDGLDDPNPRVRWWCVQLLDHVPDRRAIVAVARALDDPVPRVRRNAAHALACVACKPDWHGGLPAGVTAQLERLATSDPNPNVRTLAQHALICRPATGAPG